MATAVIELNSLPDPVRAAAKNHDLLLAARLGLVLFFVRGIEVRRIRVEFRRARIHALVHGHDRVIAALRRYITRLRANQAGDARVGEAGLLDFAEKLRRKRLDGVHRNLFDQVRDFLHLVEEPRIDVRELDELGDAESVGDGVQEIRNAVRRRRDQLMADEVLIDLLRARILAALQRAHAFEKGFFKGPADGHRLADGFHLSAERRVGVGEFLERPLRNLDDDVIEHRLE